MTNPDISKVMIQVPLADLIDLWEKANAYSITTIGEYVDESYAPLTEDGPMVVPEDPASIVTKVSAFFEDTI